MILIEVKPYLLLKKHVFRIAGGARTSTPIVLVRLKYNGFEGYGEASMPPLYGETIASAQAFIKTLDFSNISYPFDLGNISAYLDRHA
jgi:L-alanine-DL-glutamate epimerase-like enolase superfamily enzyme